SPNARIRYRFFNTLLEALDDLPKEKIGEILMKAEGLKLDGRSKTVQDVMRALAKREEATTNHKKPERPDQATQFLEQYATGIPKLLKNAKSIGVVAGAIDQIAGYCQAKISQNEQVTKFGVQKELMELRLNGEMLAEFLQKAAGVELDGDS